MDCSLECYQGNIMRERGLSMDDKAGLKALRHIVGMQQKEIADVMGVTKMTVNRWENPSEKWKPKKEAVEYVVMRSDSFIDDVREKVEAIPEQPGAVLIRLPEDQYGEEYAKALVTGAHLMILGHQVEWEFGDVGQRHATVEYALVRLEDAEEEEQVG